MKFIPGLLAIGVSADGNKKRREDVDFKCFNIGEIKSNNEKESLGCPQVFDTIETTNLACSLFEQCLLIGQNSDGNFELFSESDDDTVIDLTNYNRSIPTLDKIETSLIYDFTTLLNHKDMVITQITAYDPVLDISVVEVPEHGDVPKSTHMNFYDQNLSIVVQKNTCVIQHPELTEKLTGHMATTIDFEEKIQNGNLVADHGEYSLADLSYIKDQLPLIAKKRCHGKPLIGLDFDLKHLAHETDSGAKFLFMNETESLDSENSFSRSKRYGPGLWAIGPEGLDPVTGLIGSMVYCDGEKACGNAMFVAAACGSNSCGTLFSHLIRRGLVESPGKPIARTQAERQRATTISYLKIIKKGYWCNTPVVYALLYF